MVIEQHSDRKRLEAEHIFALSAFLICAFVLFLTIPAVSIPGIAAILLAIISTIAWGIPVVAILCPQLAVEIRVGLVLAVGYVLTIFVGFMLGLLRVEILYWVVTLLCFAVWAASARRTYQLNHPKEALPWMRSIKAVLSSSTVFVLIGITFLGILVASPMMAPLKQVAPNQYLDYAYIDNYYHLIRAQVFQAGAPATLFPDLVGVKPIVYPDYHHFWMGQLARWSGASVTDIYFRISPITLILFNTVLLYAVGKTLTRSRWGGFLASALVYLVVIPSPWDANKLLMNVEVVSRTSIEMHFQDLRYNLSIGAGWFIFSAVALALSAWRNHARDKTGIGLLILGSVLCVALLRLRSHYFITAAIPYLVILALLFLKQRRMQMLLPFAAFFLLTGFVFVESTSSVYSAASASLEIAYGPYAGSLVGSLPAPVASLVQIFPGPMVPILALAFYVFLFSFGFLYLLLFISWLIQVALRQTSITLAHWFLLGTLVVTCLAAATIVLGGSTEATGNWGAQALSLLPRVALLLGIVPLYNLLAFLQRRSPVIKTYRPLLAILLVGIMSVISYRAADANVYKLPTRAYKITQQELELYQWIREHTAPLAVVAADPLHVVNRRGETVESTNFLSGMTERPAYLQREIPFEAFAAETNQRRNSLERLFETTSVDEVKRLVDATKFDYLLVYPDKTPRVDLSCCLELVRDEGTKLYFDRGE